MNMSYCRYENTLHDVKDCLSNTIDHVNEEAKYSVSEREINCFRSMVKEFYDFMITCGLIDEDTPLDEEQLDEVCFLMEKGNNEDD